MIGLNSSNSKKSSPSHTNFSGLNRVAVGLSWTRARASNPRFEQGWVHSFCPKELNELEILFERIKRVRVLVRRIKSNRHTCSSNWIEQEFLFARTFNSSLLYESIFELSAQLTNRTIVLRFSNWVRTLSSVRRVDLSDQILFNPSPELARMSWP